MPQNSEWLVLASVLGLLIVLEAGPKLLNFIKNKKAKRS
jgi:hypothetical protein